MGEVRDVREVGTRNVKLHAIYEAERLVFLMAAVTEENVQLLADLGIEPVIMPKEGAGALAKGHPAWRKLILEFMELGVERWIEGKAIA